MCSSGGPSIKRVEQKAGNLGYRVTKVSPEMGLVGWVIYTVCNGEIVFGHHKLGRINQWLTVERGARIELKRQDRETAKQLRAMKKGLPNA